MPSNYPPGVTGNEPQITGEWSADELNDQLAEAKRSIEDTVNDILATFDDQGALGKVDDRRIDEAKDKLLDVLDDLELQTEPDYG